MTPAPPLRRRLGTCPRCGDDVVLLPGIKAGRPVRLMYNAEGSRLHKFSCTAATYPQVKHCPRCDEDKPAAEFHLDHTRGDGLHDWCKLCRKVYDCRTEHEKVTP